MQQFSDFILHIVRQLLKVIYFKKVKEIDILKRICDGMTIFNTNILSIQLKLQYTSLLFKVVYQCQIISL